MTVEIQDEPLRGLRLTPERLKLEAAVGLYASEDATLGQAAAFAGVSQSEFLHALGHRGVCVHYDLEEFEADVRTLEKSGRIPQR
jgi:predicted HTH domain antitoxin